MDPEKENSPNLQQYFKDCVSGIQQSIGPPSLSQNQPIGHLLTENVKKLSRKEQSADSREKNGAKLVINYRIPQRNYGKGSIKENSKSNKFQPFYETGESQNNQTQPQFDSSQYAKERQFQAQHSNAYPKVTRSQDNIENNKNIENSCEEIYRVKQSQQAHNDPHYLKFQRFLSIKKANVASPLKRNQNKIQTDENSSQRARKFQNCPHPSDRDKMRVPPSFNSMNIPSKHEFSNSSNVPNMAETFTKDMVLNNPELAARVGKLPNKYINKYGQTVINHPQHQQPHPYQKYNKRRPSAHQIWNMNPNSNFRQNNFKTNSVSFKNYTQRQPMQPGIQSMPQIRVNKFQPYEPEGYEVSPQKPQKQKPHTNKSSFNNCKIPLRSNQNLMSYIQSRQSSGQMNLNQPMNQETRPRNLVNAKPELPPKSTKPKFNQNQNQLLPKQLKKRKPHHIQDYEGQYSYRRNPFHNRPMPKGDAQLIQPWRKTSQIIGARDFKKAKYPQNALSNRNKNIQLKPKWNENQPPSQYMFKVEKVKKVNQGKFQFQQQRQQMNHGGKSYKPQNNLLFTLKNGTERRKNFLGNQLRGMNHKYEVDTFSKGKENRNYNIDVVNLNSGAKNDAQFSSSEPDVNFSSSDYSGKKPSNTHARLKDSKKNDDKIIKLLDFYDSPNDKPQKKPTTNQEKTKLIDSPGADQLLKRFAEEGEESSSSPILNLLDRSPKLKTYNKKCVKKHILLEPSERTAEIKEVQTGDECKATISSGMELENSANDNPFNPSKQKESAIDRVMKRALKAFDETSSSTDQDILKEFDDSCSDLNPENDKQSENEGIKGEHFRNFPTKFNLKLENEAQNLEDFLQKKAKQIREENFEKNKLKVPKVNYADQKALEALMQDTEVAHPPPVISLRSEYEIGEKLGQGAFSIVKKIIRKTDGKEFAIKICKPKSGWPTARGEAKLLDYLRHKNIIKFERFYHKKGRVRTHSHFRYISLKIPNFLTRLILSWNTARAKR